MIRLILIGMFVTFSFLVMLVTNTGFGCHVQDKLASRLGIEECTK